MMRRFLPSVVQNSPEADVVVVDNGSTDDSLVWLESAMPAVRIVKLDRNYGFAEGYHRGLKALEDSSRPPLKGRNRRHINMVMIFFIAIPSF